MVEISCKGIKKVKIEILPIPDFPTDEEWKNYVIENLPPFDTVITGNPRTREIFQKAKKKVLRLKIRKEIKGEYIRKNLLLQDTRQLKKMLPIEVVDYLMKIHASSRIAQVFQSERKTPNLCVDMIFKDKQ
jgi:nicotinamide mononucleotide adenylyltransferase